MSYKIPNAITSNESGWCPGCGHGIVARLNVEVVEGL